MKKHGIMKIASLLVLAAVVALACASCSALANQAAVKITVENDPRAGDVTVTAEVSGYTLGEGRGQIVYYLDASVPTYYEHSAVSKAGTYAVSTDTNYTWTNVTPGEHTFAVQLVNKETMPLPSPVTDKATVTVGAPAGDPGLSITNPADGDSLPPGNILIVAEVNNFIVSAADMGVIVREGEGHLIYYIDEVPPTDPGAPAKTDTCAISTELSRLWKSVSQGQHTFSVQLVNNDDTPLDTPVTATVTLDIKP